MRRNEIDVKLALKGAEETKIALDVLTSITHLKRKAKEETLTPWKQQWHTSKHGRSSRGTPATTLPLQSEEQSADELHPQSPR